MSFDYKAIVGEENIINTIESITPDGKIIQWVEADLANVEMDVDEYNVRWGGENVSKEKQEERIRIEAPKEHKNLVKSLQFIPSASEPIIAYLNPGMKRVQKIHGHRRGIAAEDAGIEKLRVLIAMNIDESTKKFLRDHPEANPSKVLHTNYARARVVYNELRGVEDKSKREAKIGEIMQRTGLKRNQVLTAERRSIFMDQVCERIGVSPEERKNQFKTFATCDQLNENEFQELRHKGEFVRLQHLDNLMHAYIKHQVAHDDVKTTINYLSHSVPSDPILVSVYDGEVDLNSIDSLRELTANVRLAMIRSESPVKEVRKALDREWNRTFELQDKTVASDIVSLLETQIQKFRSLEKTLV
ncbi:MAG: hypothetical protein M9899_04445 [Bdellovibrionaceae bacterium]|nr:hypothetical protein [Pseudobdellovibrionaceae bacterium]